MPWTRKKKISYCCCLGKRTQSRQLCSRLRARKGKGEMLDLSLWGSIIHRRRPAQKGVATEEAARREEKWATQCPPYVIQPIVGDTNLSSDASAGDLCMLIFIDLAHLFMRRGHCLQTHRSTKLAVLPLIGRRKNPATWRQMPHKKKKPTRFVSAPAHTCHLPPGLVIIVPVRCHWGVVVMVVVMGLYVWVDEPSLWVWQAADTATADGLPLHRGAGPVSCCAFMQLWPFWHKCALTTGAAPS